MSATDLVGHDLEAPKDRNSEPVGLGCGLSGVGSAENRGPCQAPGVGTSGFTRGWASLTHLIVLRPLTDSQDAAARAEVVEMSIWRSWSKGSNAMVLARWMALSN